MFNCSVVESKLELLEVNWKSIGFEEPNWNELAQIIKS
jgi:hypothetical protein